MLFPVSLSLTLSFYIGVFFRLAQKYLGSFFFNPYRQSKNNEELLNITFDSYNRLSGSTLPRSAFNYLTVVVGSFSPIRNWSFFEIAFKDYCYFLVNSEIHLVVKFAVSYKSGLKNEY